MGRQGPNATQNAAATRAKSHTSESQNNKSSRLMVEFCQKMSVELRMRSGQRPIFTGTRAIKLVILRQ
jgi:hypothetical protein